MSLSTAIEPYGHASKGAVARTGGPQEHASLPTVGIARARAEAPTVALVLFGTGVVGGSLLKLLDTPAALRRQLVGVANSRQQRCAAAGLDSRRLGDLLDDCGHPRDD